MDDAIKRYLASKVVGDIRSKSIQMILQKY